MLNPNQLHEYQKNAVKFQVTRNCSALWLDMGLGKTVITLSSITHLINQGHIKSALIVAPVRVCRMVWKQEASKWSHTKHLRFVPILGTKDSRLRGLKTKGDIYLINYENIKWLSDILVKYFINKGVKLPFDAVVWDELSKMKNSSSQRSKAFRRITPHMKWRTGLTGTPASNGIKDLHGQYLVLDGGERLGKTKTIFKQNFLVEEGMYNLVERDGAKEQIEGLISDITLQMSADDYLSLPAMVCNDIMVELPARARVYYEELEKSFFTILDNEKEIEVPNKAALTNKCLQLSNGAMYPVPLFPEWEPVHDAKLEALDEVIEEASGKPVLCAYNYRSDAARIMERYAHLNPINIGACKTQASLDNVMARWRSGDCPLMIGHPASMGHGLDGLQDACNIIVWFGLNWSLDLYDQFNARIQRQGQKKTVFCHRILCSDTLDEAQSAALAIKSSTQSGLRKAIDDYRKRKDQLS